jgi:hypothetical protein
MEYGNWMQTNREPSGRSLQSMKMETGCFSKTSASTCKYTQRQNPRPLQLYGCSFINAVTHNILTNLKKTFEDQQTKRDSGGTKCAFLSSMVSVYAPVLETSRNIRDHVSLAL